MAGKKGGRKGAVAPKLVLTPPPPEPTPPAPKSKWRQRWDRVCYRLFAPIKIPAFPFLIWELMQWIPDWDSRVRYWIGAAEKAGGVVGAAAAIVEAPGVQLAMTIGALAWLILVGEPEKHVRRDHRWRYVGWTIVVVFFGAITVTAGYGMFQIAVEKAAARRATPYNPWRLTDKQLQIVNEFAARNKTKHPIFVESLLGSSQSQSFGFSLARALGERHWPVQWAIDPGLRPDLVGISVSYPRGVDLSKGDHEQIKATIELIRALGFLENDPKSPWEAIHAPDALVSPDSLWINVGNEP